MQTQRQTTTKIPTQTKTQIENHPIAKLRSKHKGKPAHLPHVRATPVQPSILQSPMKEFKAFESACIAAPKDEQDNKAYHKRAQDFSSFLVPAACGRTNPAPSLLPHTVNTHCLMLSCAYDSSPHKQTHAVTHSLVHSLSGPFYNLHSRYTHIV